MRADTPDDTAVAWRPDPGAAERTFLRRFQRRVGVADLAGLQERSEADPAWFWDELVRELGIVWRRPYDQVLDTSRGLPWPRFFVGGRLNIADSLVDRHLADPATSRRVAVAWEGDDGRTDSLTYADLASQADRLAGGLAALGVGPEDRIGMYLPMVPAVAVVMVAAAKLGCAFVPIFSGYGADAVATRLADCQASVLVTADAYYRRGRRVEMKREADRALALVGSVRHTVVVRRAGGEVPWTVGRDHDWEELLATGEPLFAGREVDPDHPAMVIYTSGTTGRPKGAVHGHAGFPVKSAADLALCFDLGPGDTLLWITDMGWMMGPWMVYGALLRGATMLLYEGVPDHPRPDRLWALCGRHHVTHLGLSPTVVRALMAHGDKWLASGDLGTLRAFGSTGEPWNPRPWWWLFDTVGHGRLPIINYSGGTEVSGGILGCFVAEPQKPCAFTAPIPGMAADVVDADGRPIVGEVGELVLRAPWVGITQGFFGDRERYLATYWSRWPDVWVHGDWARRDADGYFYIEGRSDDTLKIAGKRVGPAELESALMAHPAVLAAAAVGVPHPVKGEAAACFVVPAVGIDPTPALAGELGDWVAARLGRALRPEVVRFVADLPHTRNGKILRRLIRRVWLGQDLGDTSALENPAAVEAIRQAR